MSEDDELKALERKAYRSIFDDGIWDLFMGLIILSIGLSTFIGTILNLPEGWDTIIPVLIMNIIAFLIFYLGKKFITIPRMGFVKFGPKRKVKQLKLKIFLLFMFLVNIILLFIPLTGVLRNIQIQPLMLTLVLGLGAFTLPFCVVPYYLEFTRLYFYAFLAGIGLFLTEMLNPIVSSPLDIILSFAITGGAIVIIGLYYFIRFLKKYPLSE
ncbi:MAG: hypothetical protein CEE43_04885 [Promethearchaeota archaeon Loki_b32]|nr:MAG: hypothetical protein CEE43_04885 [Candidatus Lokiarchaeota archaeon Loki_b32]